MLSSAPQVPPLVVLVHLWVHVSVIQHSNLSHHNQSPWTPLQVEDCLHLKHLRHNYYLLPTYHTTFVQHHLHPELFHPSSMWIPSLKNASSSSLDFTPTKSHARVLLRSSEASSKHILSSLPLFLELILALHLIPQSFSISWALACFPFFVNLQKESMLHLVTNQ